MPQSPHAALAALASLGDRTRQALYDHVASARTPVTRDAAAHAVGVDRSVAAYHLDRLVEDGLLVPSFARPEGRTGPGAGRPAKQYERAPGEISVSLPPRSYDVLAELLATAVEGDTTGSVRDVLHDAAAALGARMAAHGGDVAGALAEQGFEPYQDGDVLRLANCPFHQLARRHTELVCSMNLSLMSALADAADADLRPQLDPAPGRCCVAFTR